MKQTTEKNRERLRHALYNYDTKDRNKLLKNTLITITTSKTNYSLTTFQRKIRLINAVLNKALFKRGWKKHINRIVFFTFFETSAQKELLHCHLIIRVPEFMERNYLFALLNGIVWGKFEMDFDVRERHNAIKYATKHFRYDNDNYTVN